MGLSLLKLFGWKVELLSDIKNLNRCILVSAPHTSNWDFALGIVGFWAIGKPLKVIIKDSHTKAFYGGIVKKLGGIGIDRSQKNNVVEFIKKEFEKEDFSLVITPEGTRSYVKKWKLGFYHMAIGTGVPVCCAYGDYKNKVIGIGKVIQDFHTRPFESVMQEMEDFYREIPSKYPENYNPKIF